jgi:hypothetical protein
MRKSRKDFFGEAMEQLRNLGDERQTATCVYRTWRCRGDTTTGDHVPSKVFLDEPYPSNLPVVPSCQPCNDSFSKDEEYVACLIECASVGSVNPIDIRREKVKQIIQRSPKLVSRLSQARKMMGDGIYFNIEDNRVRNVLLKLGRGHAAFELNEPQYDEPSIMTYGSLASMTPDNLKKFETPLRSLLLPEVGSRAMQRLIIGSEASMEWITVQPGRYRYLTLLDGRVIIRVVISEYLGCEIVWT